MKNILLVDDDKFTRIILRGYLEKEGYVVSEAKNGKTALQKQSENHFDLIISDILMPDMDGLELLMELKQKPDVKIIIITGSPKYYLKTAEALGALYVLVKPIKKDLLLTKVASCI